jgi:hypothetical protein
MERVHLCGSKMALDTPSAPPDTHISVFFCGTEMFPRKSTEVVWVFGGVGYCLCGKQSCWCH